MREHTGAIPATMYSFEEVVSLFKDPFPFVSFKELEKWVRDVIPDGELADNIAETVKIRTSDRDRSLLIGKLME